MLCRVRFKLCYPKNLLNCSSSYEHFFRTTRSDLGIRHWVELRCCSVVYLIISKILSNYAELQQLTNYTSSSFPTPCNHVAMLMFQNVVEQLLDQWFCSFNFMTDQQTLSVSSCILLLLLMCHQLLGEIWRNIRVIVDESATKQLLHFIVLVMKMYISAHEKSWNCNK